MGRYGVWRISAIVAALARGLAIFVDSFDRRFFGWNILKLSEGFYYVEGCHRQSRQTASPRESDLTTPGRAACDRVFSAYLLDGWAVLRASLSCYFYFRHCCYGFCGVVVFLGWFHSTVRWLVVNFVFLSGSVVNGDTELRQIAFLNWIYLGPLPLWEWDCHRDRRKNRAS